MKFLIVVLAVHFLAEWVMNKRKHNTEDADENELVAPSHPAEYRLRE